LQFCDLANEKPGTVFKLPSCAMVKLRNAAIGSQGLRGLDPGVVWRREISLPHWKPGRKIAKSNNS
jgi:hypothetical protein